MDYIFWLVIGIMLMAIEIGYTRWYCWAHRIQCVHVGCLYRPWWNRFSFIRSTWYHNTLSCIIINLL